MIKAPVHPGICPPSRVECDVHTSVGRLTVEYRYGQEHFIVGWYQGDPMKRYNVLVTGKAGDEPAVVHTYAKRHVRYKADQPRFRSVLMAIRDEIPPTLYDELRYIVNKNHRDAIEWQKKMTEFDDITQLIELAKKHNYDIVEKIDA